MGYDGNILNYTGKPDHIESVGTKVRRFIDIVRTGLIVHYDMMNIDCYDRVGSTVNDLTGNGHTGTLAGGYDFTTDGGIHFDGINGNLVYTMNFPTQWTHLIYAKSNQATWSNYNALGASRELNGISMHTWQGATTMSAGFTDQFGIGNGIYVAIPADIQLPQMYALTTNGNNSIFYVNQGQYIVTGLINRDNSTTSQIYIANDAPPYNSRFTECTVYCHLAYNRELTFDEIKQNHKALQSRFPI